MFLNKFVIPRTAQEKLAVKKELSDDIGLEFPFFSILSKDIP